MHENHRSTSNSVTRRRYLQLATVGGSVLALGTGDSTAADHTNRDVTIRSDDSKNPIDIAATVYRPAGASSDDPVPMIVHSHGWSGSRTASDGAFQRELDAGFGVLSFDQRGHGDSGGKAYVQEPRREGRDVIAVLDFVAELEWVARSLPKGMPLPKKDNPMVFAMGQSYGGGFQLVGALTETRLKGYTRFDALSPRIAWYDLPEALAPEAVPRTLWLTFLNAVGAPMVPQYVQEAFAYSAATGEWPDGDPAGEPDIDTKFHGNGPVGFVEDGIRLDVPVLFGQGMADNLFNFNEGWKNFERTLTDEARAKSALIGDNYGHTLPSAVPAGEPLVPNTVGTRPPSFQEKRLRFFEAVRDGTGDARSVVGAPYLLTTASGDRLLAVDTVDDRTRFGTVDLSVAGDGAGGLGVLDIDTVATTTGVGAPIYLPLTEGPLTVAGVPNLSAAVTTAGVNQRIFAGLAVGESPATAQVIQNNVMPLGEPTPVTAAERTVELPGVAADVGAGEQLYLALSATADMFVGHGSTRTPGTIVLEDLSVGVPLTG